MNAFCFCVLVSFRRSSTAVFQRGFILPGCVRDERYPNYTLPTPSVEYKMNTKERTEIICSGYETFAVSLATFVWSLKKRCLVRELNLLIDLLQEMIPENRNKHKLYEENVYDRSFLFYLVVLCLLSCGIPI